MRLRSSLHCPSCGKEEELTMPENAFIVFYRCGACDFGLRRKPGECCVFCSYGSVPCPPVQQQGRFGGEPEEERDR